MLTHYVVHCLCIFSNTFILIFFDKYWQPWHLVAHQTTLCDWLQKYTNVNMCLWQWIWYYIQYCGKEIAPREGLWSPLKCWDHNLFYDFTKLRPNNITTPFHSTAIAIPLTTIDYYDKTWWANTRSENQSSDTM